MRTKNESIENSIGLDEFEVLFKDQDQDNETDDDEAVEDNSDILKIIEQEEHNEDFNTTLNTTVQNHLQQVDEWKRNGMDKVMESFCVKDLECIVGPWIRNKTMMAQNDTISIFKTQIVSNDAIPIFKNRSNPNKIIKSYKRSKPSKIMYSHISEESNESSDDSVQEIKYLKSLPRTKPKCSADIIVREYIIKNHDLYKFIGNNGVDESGIPKIVYTLPSSTTLDIIKTPISTNHKNKCQSEKQNRKKILPEKRFSKTIIISDSEDEVSAFSFNTGNIVNSTVKVSQNEITFNPENIVNSTTNSSNISISSGLNDSTLKNKVLCSAKDKMGLSGIEILCSPSGTQSTYQQLGDRYVKLFSLMAGGWLATVNTAVIENN